MQVTCSRCSRVLEYQAERPLFCSFCGQALSDPRGAATRDYPAEAPTLDPAPARLADLPPPPSVGGYRLVRQLGAGGMGRVYEAEHPETGRRVALKLIAGDFASRPDAVERFRQEGRLAGLVSHPRSVFVLAADEEAGRPYIVMELMPGETLADLVERRGPLPPREAVEKILDVIDGLEEAHACGLVHRDVKPSNCFLDSDGRVKVGDFGLSKSLVKDSNLTRTGAFLGTPLFAAPEQVRGETVDRQSDVYSVAATLYFLLAGKAPFQSSDPAVTLARIAADPAPPLRSVREELPPALERVVMRGLERDRKRRWPSLAEFREALQPFLPRAVVPGGLGARFAAYVLDGVALKILGALLAGLYFLLGLATKNLVYLVLLDSGLWWAYFTLFEGLWGATPGKRLMRLRVAREDDADPPAPAQIGLRAMVFVGLLNFNQIVASLVTVYFQGIIPPGLRAALSLAGLGGLAALLLPMWRSPFRRGLHERLSLTRVERLPATYSLRMLQADAESFADGLPLDQPKDLPAEVGGFAVRGALRWERAERVLLSRDEALGRDVLLLLRPATAEPLAPARRNLTRLSRLRWLAGGRQGDWQWDAFQAPAARPLTAVVAEHGRFDWAEFRPFLEQLTEELQTARADGTLPDQLQMDNVWVQARGRPLLLDQPLARLLPAPLQEPGDEGELVARALRQVIQLVLTGEPSLGLDERVCAPLPGHAATVLNRLFADRAHPDPATRLAEDLRATHDEPAEVTRAKRASQLTLAGLLLAPGLGWMLLMGWLMMFLVAVGSSEEIVIRERVRDGLLELAVREDLPACLVPDPMARVFGATRAADDLRLAARLDEQIARERQDRDEAVRGMSAVWKPLVDLVENRQRAADRSRPPNQGEPPFSAMAHFRANAPPLAEMEREQEVRIFGWFVVFAAVVMTAWPALWLVSAFVFRGGLSLRLAGLRLVRGDGRRAGRFQCVWRTFVTWAPVTLLLGASFWLDLRYIDLEDTGLAGAGTAWLSWAVWWSAVVVLALYVVAALRWPTRGPHDRLAGTYLVPR